MRPADVAYDVALWREEVFGVRVAKPVEDAVFFDGTPYVICHPIDRLPTGADTSWRRGIWVSDVPFAWSGRRAGIWIG